MKKNYNQPQTEFVRDFCTGAICDDPREGIGTFSGNNEGWGTGAPIRKF